MQTGGWHMSTNAKKRHYYQLKDQGRTMIISLCRRWFLVEETTLDPNPSPDGLDCATCTKRLKGS